MRPEDAKTKWCPHVRTGLVQGMAVNHSISMTSDGQGPVNVHDETRCIAGGCMMWQWHRTEGSNDLSLDFGYCGLAGDSQ